MMNNVIVIGGGHHNTLGVVRALGQSSIGVELITIGGKKDCYVSSSRYVHTHHAIIDVKQLSVCLLSRKASADGQKEIVISCSDSVTEELNICYEVLSERYILPGCDEQGKMVMMMDKTKMIDMAEKHGLKVPVVWRLPQDKLQVTYPCITKSYLSSHGGKDDVKIFYSQEILNAFLANCKDEIFAQPYIEKKEEVQFIGCSLNKGNEIIIPGMTRILRSQPNTNTGFLEYGPIDSYYAETLERSKQYIRDCGYSGLFSIEFIRSKNDDIYFLEINFRNDGNAWCVTAAGVNLPSIWVKANIGLDYKNEIKKVNRIIVMPEFQDFKLVLQRKISLGQWLKDWWRTDAYLDWNKNDKRPFFRFILNKL